jgi:hypothetical protein
MCVMLVRFHEILSAIVVLLSSAILSVRFNETLSES